MPKLYKPQKTKAQIQADSDVRRGIKVASDKLPTQFIDELAELSAKTGLLRSDIIMAAVRSWKQSPID